MAQEISPKLVLKKGDKIKVTTEMNSSNSQSMMGREPMESKTKTNSYTELEVKEVLDNAYIITQTLKTMKLSFDGFGQKMNYDSESKEKQDNPFTKQIAQKVNVGEDFKIALNGKLIENQKANESKKDDKKEGRGFMRMMGGNGGNVVESAFLIIPKDAVAKGGWEDTTTNDGLTTRKKYSIGAIMGNMATVTVQAQTKGEIEMNRGGMAMTTKVNITSEEMIMVDISTGKVQMHTVNSNDNSHTIANDMDNPSTGKTTITSTYE
jgi:hypothetical protein